MYQCNKCTKCTNIQIYKNKINKYIAGPSGDCADRRLSALYIQNTRKVSAD